LDRDIIEIKTNLTIYGQKTTKPKIYRWADQCGPFRDTNHQFPGIPNVALNFGHVWSASVVDDKELEGLIMDWYNEVDYLKKKTFLD